jgi:predicted RNA binding protein YcfA (HicA-like mRNA interferase family)
MVEETVKSYRVAYERDESGWWVASNAGEDIGPGLLRRIERDLEPCLGREWLRKP